MMGHRSDKKEKQTKNKHTGSFSHRASSPRQRCRRLQAWCRSGTGGRTLCNDNDCHNFDNYYGVNDITDNNRDNHDNHDIYDHYNNYGSNNNHYHDCHHKSDDLDRMTITDMCPEVDLSSACSSSLATQEGHPQET